MTDKYARVWSGTEWVNVSSPIASPNAVAVYQSTAPSSPVTGQIWVDSDDNISYVWNGSSWGATSSDLSLYAPIASPTFTGTVTSSGMIVGNAGGQSLTIRPASADHTYIGFNARTTTPNTRTAYVGFPGAASAIFTIANEISGGNIALVTTGAGVVTAPTAASGTNTTQIATTAFVTAGFEKTIPLQSSAPSSPASSDLWVDNTSPTSPTLKVYNGTSWITAGSSITADDDQIILASRIFG